MVNLRAPRCAVFSGIKEVSWWYGRSKKITLGVPKPGGKRSRTTNRVEGGWLLTWNRATPKKTVCSSGCKRCGLERWVWVWGDSLPARPGTKGIVSWAARPESSLRLRRKCTSNLTCQFFSTAAHYPILHPAEALPDSPTRTETRKRTCQPTKDARLQKQTPVTLEGNGVYLVG